METVDQVEGLLIELNLPYEEIDSGIWLVSDESETTKAVVTASGPVVDIRINIARAPDPPDVELLKKLLELNATELLYGAYGLDDTGIVLVEVLTAKHLNLELFREALDALFMTVATQRGIVLRALQGHQADTEA